MATKYKIVVGTDRARFEEDVNILLAQGYDLEGGMAYSNSVFTQAMTKEEKTTNVDSKK